VISDIVSDILDKQRKTKMSVQKQRAKDESVDDALKVNSEIKEMAKAESKPEKKEDPPKEESKEAPPDEEDEDMVPAVPNVDLSSNDPNQFVKRFLANVADSKLLLTKDQLRELEHDIKNINISASTAILKCKGPDECVYGKICILNRLNGTWPIDQPCPMEKTIAEISYREYLHALHKTPEDIGIIEYNQIMSLIECDLLEMRANCRLNDEGLTRMVTTFVNHKTGDRAETEELSVMFGIKDRVAKRKDTILKQLLATPEIQAKYKVTNLADKERKDARQLVKDARTKLIEMKKDGTYTVDGKSTK
jgi:hypothetical protein